jgi:hypothetical protein
MTNWENKNNIDKLEELVHKTSKNIDRISEDIGNLKDALKLEAESRKTALELESKAREEISKKINTKIERFKGALWLATALGATFATLLIGYLTGLIKF